MFLIGKNLPCQVNCMVLQDSKFRGGTHQWVRRVDDCVDVWVLIRMLSHLVEVVAFGCSHEAHGAIKL